MKPQPLLADNPVLTLSLRRAMRRGSTFALQFLYLAALLALTAIVYALTFSGPTPPAEASPQMGRTLFLWLGLVQTGFLAMTASVLGAGSIALERELRTFETLQLTRMSALQILIGKYASLLLMHGLLIVTSIPIACLGFLFGGVSPGEVIRSTLLVFLSTSAALALGVAVSAHCARGTLAASIAAAVALGGLIGVPVLLYAYAIYLSPTTTAQSNSLVHLMIVLNPLFAEVYLFMPSPGVPVEAADGDALVLAAVAVIAWFAALARLRAEEAVPDA